MDSKTWQKLGLLAGGAVVLIGAVAYARTYDGPYPEPEEPAPNTPFDVPEATMVPVTVLVPTPPTPPTPPARTPPDVTPPIAAHARVDLSPRCIAQKANPATTPPRNFRLSPHFTYGEFWQKACRQKNIPVTPYPVEWIDTRLRPLVAILERIRREFDGATIKINSAYRAPAYNKPPCTKEAATFSQHLCGRAVDIQVVGVSAARVQAAVRRLHAAGEITIGGLGTYNSFTHIDLRPRTNRTYATWQPKKHR